MKVRLYRGGGWSQAQMIREFDSPFSPCQDGTVTLVDDEGTLDYGVIDVRWIIGVEGAPPDHEDAVEVLIDVS